MVSVLYFLLATLYLLQAVFCKVVLKTYCNCTIEITLHEWVRACNLSAFPLRL
ncbi:hypothetical protein GLYMA_03G147150v4 [Glycine max]|nr:hypothetical protein GLYMA_03G147150v4 [Glycine max]KAH1070056.1 hypothetical protein GYH30_007257 [Glycine max]